MDNWRIMYVTIDRNVEGGKCCQPQMNLVSGEKKRGEGGVH